MAPTLTAPSVAWATGTQYTMWQPVLNGGNAYFCVVPHTAGAAFNPTNWLLLGATGATIPVTGTDGTVGGPGGTSLTSTFSGAMTVQQGTLSAIPSASSDNTFFYYATDINALFWSNGTSWILLNSGPGTADYVQTGVHVPPSESAETTTVMTANQGYFRRFAVDRQITISTAKFYVTVAATNNDNCDVGIFTTAGLFVASNGGSAAIVNSTGVRSVPLAVTLNPGVPYVFAFSYGAVGGTAATIITSTKTSGGVSTTLPGASSGSPGNQEQGFRAAMYPLPTSGTPAVGTITGIATVPKVYLS